MSPNSMLQEPRAHTPEARVLRAERQERRQRPSPGTSARSCYAFWLNEFMSDRQPGEPYPMGKKYAHRFLAHTRNFHLAMLADH